MPKKIQVLPESLSRMIAAGEVVERPASVVKELMENAIDAGASLVVVELRAGGLQLIRVEDNGEGMDREDVPVALERHATSKIRSLEDLYAIRTLGFRGEALPSIASVSQMVIKTRPAHSATGTKLVSEGGKIQAVSEIGCPVGTEVEVRNLFFNLPVKRKFLKSISLELRHALSQFVRLSLLHPEISFKLIHEGRLVHEFLKTARMEVRIEAIYGREFYGQLQPFNDDNGEIRLSGWASLPTFSRGNGDAISLYVNGRFVKDRTIYRAVLEAYRHIIPQGRFPMVILFLQVLPFSIDVNVHPTKTEVKFKEPERIFQAVFSALHALHEPSASQKEPRKTAGQNENPRSEPESFSLPFYLPVTYPRGGYREIAGTDPKVCEAGALEGWGEGRKREIEQKPFRVLGQVLGTYILCEDSDGLIFIDQHAAHERLLYERLKRGYETESLSIHRFLTPVLMECSPEEAATLESHIPGLSAMGFEIDVAGRGVFAIRSAPALIEQEGARELIRRILEEGIFHEPRREGNEALHPFLVTLSCHSAVRANFEMRKEEMEALLEDLQSFPLSTTCPHGRPIFFHLPFPDLEKKFKRAPR